MSQPGEPGGSLDPDKAKPDKTKPGGGGQDDEWGHKFHIRVVALVVSARNTHPGRRLVFQQEKEPARFWGLDGF